MRRAALALVALCACSLLAGRASAWEPFRSQNGEVLEGNEHLKKGQVKEAIASYDAAARRLPNEPGVHLDRGLALLKAGKLPEAREALRLAAQADADPELRGMANYDLGLAFLRAADAASKQENMDEAQKLLREAVEAFKSSLRTRPRSRDAAWNLELARRRLVDLEKKQQEQKQQDQDKKKQQDQDKKKQQDQQQKDGDPDQQQPDGGQGDSESDAGSPEQQPQAGDSGTPEPEPEAKPNQEQGAPEPTQRQAEPALPEHMQKALDALEDSEENLQKHRAAMRARQRPRRIEKDW